MNRQEAIREACEIVGLAYGVIGDYTSASDGFCDKCTERLGPDWPYQNGGVALAYVRKAVVEKLKADGYEVPSAIERPEREEAR